MLNDYVITIVRANNIDSMYTTRKIIKLFYWY